MISASETDENRIAGPPGKRTRECHRATRRSSPEAAPGRGHGRPGCRSGSSRRAALGGCREARVPRGRTARRERLGDGQGTTDDPVRTQGGIRSRSLALVRTDQIDKGEGGMVPLRVFPSLNPVDRRKSSRGFTPDPDGGDQPADLEERQLPVAIDVPLVKMRNDLQGEPAGSPGAAFASARESGRAWPPVPG